MPYLHYIISGSLLVVSGIAILVIPRTRRLVLEQKELSLITGAIVLLSALSSVLSGNVIGLAVTLGIFMILTYAALLRSVMTPDLTQRVLYTVGVGSFFTLIIVLIQRFSEKNPGYRPTGWQWNANYLGSVAVLSALITLCAFFAENKNEDKKRTVLDKLFFGAAFLSNCIIILICESRSSLLALTVCFVLFLFLKKHYVLCGVAVLGGIGIWVAGLISPELFGWANSLAYVFIQRYDIWMCAFKSFLQGPIEFLIGRGPMTYRFVWAAEGLYGADHAHNILFDTLINVGIVGLVLYLFLLSDFAKNMFKRNKANDNGAFLFSALALASILVQGIADVTVMWHQTASLFVLMCALNFQKLNNY